MDSEARVRESAALAISAYNFYRKGLFQEAQMAVKEVLNLEPTNQQAKLFLAACLHNMGQSDDAKVELLSVYQNSKEDSLRQKAQMGIADLESSSTDLMGARRATWINIPTSARKG